MSLKNSFKVLWVYIMYVLGIWFFLSGFLLKRIVIHQHNPLTSNIGININCKNMISLRKVADSFQSSPLQFPTFNSNETHLRRFNKTVILLIDALRYDFVHRNNQHTHNAHYSDKLPIFKKLLHNHKNHAMLFQMLADPPTTTLQRLTGLTTGSLPTFVDISFNFASSEIKEDNIIYQMKSKGKRVVFMGDDTWENIFPNHFHISYPYPSFNVKDLDTVDDGILNHLYEKLDSNAFDVIIAHFLGVDHCGHRYGPSHPEMTRKLQQMNKVIETVVEKIKEDALLLVLGDHGMTENGDHGGDSHREISTALFLYSPSKLGNFNFNDEDIPTVRQVDVVPTLSLLLGLPIPYSNIGSVISQLFTLNNNGTCFHPQVDSLLGEALAETENILQAYNYIHAYSKVSEEMSSSFLSELQDQMEGISYLWHNLTNNIPESIEILSNISEKNKGLLLHIRTTCEKKWATFNLQNMSSGFILLFFILQASFELTMKTGYTFKVIIAYGLLALLMLVITNYFEIIDYFITPFLLFIIKVCVVISNHLAEINCSSVIKGISIPALCLVTFFIMSFSNSFVVSEDSVVMYLLLSVIIHRFFHYVTDFIRTFLVTLKKKSLKKAPKLSRRVCLLPLCLLSLTLCIRFGSVFFKCREEQPACDNSMLIMSLEKLQKDETYKVMRLVLSVMSVFLPTVIFCSLIKYWYSNKLQTISAIGMKYGSFFVSVLISLRWWLNILPSNVVDKVLKGNEVFLSQTAFLVSICMCFLIPLFPFLYEQPWQMKSKEIYHCSFLSFLLSIVQLLQLIAGDALSTSIMLMSLSTLLFIILVNDSGCSEKWIWTDAIICFFMSRFWFYATAHQPTFNSIQWDAAFVFSHKEIYSYVVSGSLVILNTFSSSLFYGLVLPFLLTCTESSIFTSESLLRLHMKYLFCVGLKILSTVWATFILRRHLMVWKIFSPKLIYEVLGLFVSMMSTAVGHLFLKKVASHYHKLIRMNLSHVFESKEQ